MSFFLSDMEGVRPKKDSISWSYLIIFGAIALAVFLWFRLPFPGPSQTEMEIREPKLIEQEKPLNYENKIDIGKAKENPPDITGLAVDEGTTPGIEFRTIHAICRPEDPDCYVVSMPFHFQYIEGQDKVRLVLIRVENDNLSSPDLTYWEDKENEETQKFHLNNLRFDTVSYPYIGTKGNVFLDLTLDIGKTYCFQLVEGSLKSDIWCQNFELGVFSRDFIEFSLIPTENQSQLHLVVIFNTYGKETIRNLLKESSLTLTYPDEFNKDNLEFSSEDLLDNFKYCNDNYLVDLPILLEEKFIEKLMPKEENNTLIPSDYNVEVEMKHQEASLKQEARFDSSCGGPLLLCDNYV
jgi:hypothetical protein